MDDNPCFNLTKLKEGSARDHVLTQDEVQRLFVAYRESRNDYLYCIVLLAFTIGMRQGGILGVYQSVCAAAMGLSPLLVGSAVGAYPRLTAWGGALCFLFASLGFWNTKKIHQLALEKLQVEKN